MRRLLWSQGWLDEPHLADGAAVVMATIPSSHRSCVLVACFERLAGDSIGIGGGLSPFSQTTDWMRAVCRRDRRSWRENIARLILEKTASIQERGRVPAYPQSSHSDRTTFWQARRQGCARRMARMVLSENQICSLLQFTTPLYGPEKEFITQAARCEVTRRRAGACGGPGTVSTGGILAGVDVFEYIGCSGLAYVLQGMVVPLAVDRWAVIRAGSLPWSHSRACSDAGRMLTWQGPLWW